MSAEPLTIGVRCELHETPRELVVTTKEGRLVLDLHADGCCAMSLDRTAASALFKMLWGWVG